MNEKNRVRVGIDVGGTFTKAVALDLKSGDILGKSTVLTTHTSEKGVSSGIITVLDNVMKSSNITFDAIELISHSTTQAINALLESDTFKVGIVAMGVYDPNAVMPMLEGYIALLAIVGTLATLIVTSMLELWKTEQTQEIATMEDRIAHRHRMEEMEMAHVHRLAEIVATGEYVSVENEKISKDSGMGDKPSSKSKR